jgi:hypothetical protein
MLTLWVSTSSLSYQFQWVSTSSFLPTSFSGCPHLPKLDPAQIMALKKLATMKSIPYQTLIRQWLANSIRKELR